MVDASGISDSDLSWDSELDDPTSDSDSEDEFYGAHHHVSLIEKVRMLQGDHDAEHREDQPEEEDPDDRFERDPWNAVCVVGLRVYSKDGDVTIDVVRPKREEAKKGKGLDRTLDIDDSAKDATRGLGIMTPDPSYGRFGAYARRVDSAPANIELSRQG